MYWLKQSVLWGRNFKNHLQAWTDTIFLKPYLPNKKYKTKRYILSEYIEKMISKFYDSVISKVMKKNN